MAAALKAPPYKFAVIVGDSGQLGLTFKYSRHIYSICTRYEFFPSSSLDAHENFRALKRFLDAYKPDLVINTIAYTSVDEAENNKEVSYVINALLPRTLAQWCFYNKAAIVHFSTDYVYDGTSKEPYPETTLPCPINQYGLDKLTGELYIMKETPDFYIFRTSALYSPFRVNFVKKIFSKLTNPKKQGPYRFNVVRDQFTVPTSSEFLLEYMFKIISKKALGVFHVVPSGYSSWYEFALMIRSEGIKWSNLSPRAPLISPTKTRKDHNGANRPEFSVLDNSKMAKLLRTTIPEWDEVFRDCSDELLSVLKVR